MEKRAAAKNVAVIAIHGVGEHESGATAKAIANQLMENFPDRYRSFEEHGLNLPVAGRDLGHNPAPLTRMTGLFSRLISGTQSRFARREAENAASAAKSKTTGLSLEIPEVPQVRPRSDPPLDVLFSKSLLEGNENYSATYETVRYSSKLEESESTSQTDIFELYWSDLSHVKKSTPGLLSDLFQLMIHLASLGRTVSATSIPQAREAGLSRIWTWFYRLNAASYWLLSTPIVIGNFMLVLIGLLIVPTLWLSPAEPSDFSPRFEVSLAIEASVLGLCIALGTSWWLYRRLGQLSNKRFSWVIVMTPICAGAASGFLFFNLLQLGRVPDLVTLLTCAELAVLLLLGSLLMKSYDKVRPGVFLLWCLSGLALLIWVYHIDVQPQLDPGKRIFAWIGAAAEGPFDVLIVIWDLLYFVNFLLAATSIIVTIFYRRTAGPAGLVRSTHTAIIAATLPAPILLTIILTAWGLTLEAFRKELPQVTITPVTWFFHHQTQEADSFVLGLLNRSASQLFAAYSGMMLISLILVVWALGPSIFRELFPGELSKNTGQNSKGDGLGNWLDGGFGLMGVAASIAAFGFIIVFPYGSLVAFWNFPPLLDMSLYEKSFSNFIGWLALMASISTVGFIATTKALAGFFTQTVNRLRVVIDTAMDVDNWLRERPAGSTPRLKIFARFAALLRSLGSEHYSHIVIVAHSQGTVVATDFLRFMAHNQKLGGLPSIMLVTMGSPLRQLYALRFPSLYEWVHRDSLQPRCTGPVPSDCGLSYWLNVYGSGDYVGRALWADTRSDKSGKVDICIGPEAHTHYFDASCKLVAEKIDDLIRHERPS